MDRKTYPLFKQGTQEDNQSYQGGFWSGSHLEFNSPVGALTCSPKPADQYSNTTNNYNILDIEGYDGNATYDAYAILDYTTSGDIFARNASTGVWASDNTFTQVPTGGIQAFNSNLYWGTTTKVGEYVGSTDTYTDDKYSLQATQDTGLYMPFLLFAGNMYVGNMRYVGMLDPTPTWTANKLTLPAGFRIIDMRVWNDQIAILAQKTGSSVEAKVFFWDGSAATYEEVAQLNEAKPMAMITYLGALLIFGLNGRIYQYRGESADGIQDFALIRTIPGNPEIFNPSAVIMHDGEIVFGVLGKSSNTLGIWAFGRPAGTDQVILYPKYIPKGDYKYDDGVSDYYSVTTLFNFRYADDFLNPSSGNTCDTPTSDSAAGDLVWHKYATKTLPVSGRCNGMASSVDGAKLVVVIGNGTIYTSTDSGATWTARDSARNWSDVASSEDGTKLVAVVGTGQIYTSTDSGATWTARDSVRAWTDVCSSADGTTLLAAADYLYISTDSGATWTQKASNLSWEGVAMADDASVFYACSNTAVFKSTDGTTWNNVTPTSGEYNGTFSGVGCSADGAVVLLSETGGATLSTDTAANWTLIPTTSLSAHSYVGASVSDSGTVMSLAKQTSGATRSVFVSLDTGTTWEFDPEQVGDDFSNDTVVSDDGTAIFSCSQEGYVRRHYGTIATTDIDTKDDDEYVFTSSRDAAAQTSEYLKCLDFDLAIPTGATITGIKITVRAKRVNSPSSSSPTAKDYLVKLVKAGSVVGNNNGTNTDRGDTFSDYSYGSATDMWGTTWTEAQVEAADFGVVIQATTEDAALVIDWVEARVYWEATVSSQKERLFAGVSVGNATLITETMKSGIVDLTGDGFSTGQIFTTGDDLGYPDNDKSVRGISIQTTRPLTGTETIVVYQNTDNTTDQELRNISWTQIASFGAGQDQQTRYITPFTCRRLRLRFAITPLPGSPTTAPGLISYTLIYQPIGPFLAAQAT